MPGGDCGFAQSESEVMEKRRTFDWIIISLSFVLTVLGLLGIRWLHVDSSALPSSRLMLMSCRSMIELKSALARWILWS